MIGEPRSAKGLRRFGVSLPEKLLKRMPGVDIRIVADRTKRIVADRTKHMKRDEAQE
jgi:hypothetical protein